MWALITGMPIYDDTCLITITRSGMRPPITRLQCARSAMERIVNLEPFQGWSTRVVHFQCHVCQCVTKSTCSIWCSDDTYGTYVGGRRCTIIMVNNYYKTRNVSSGTRTNGITQLQRGWSASQPWNLPRDDPRELFELVRVLERPRAAPLALAWEALRNSWFNILYSM